MTVVLYDYIQSELIKRGFNEIVNDQGELVFFDDNYQFMKKIHSYDSDVEQIINDLFLEQSLDSPDFDSHFKKGFMYRFINRRINRQTIESFQLELMSTFMQNQDYMNRIYQDMDKYITQNQIGKSNTNQTNEQHTDGTTISDNRNAFSNLPQNNVQLDVDSTVMNTATDNTVSRNKQSNNQQSDGETNSETITDNKSYQLDELFKSNGLLEQIYNVFDVKCFMQTW